MIKRPPTSRKQPDDISSSELATALAAAISAAKEAGELLRAELYCPDGPRGHGSHADVDVEVERLLKQRLLAACPWNWLGEETRSSEAANSPYWWVIDPHDGTSAFLKGYRGTAVSIAVLREGKPVLGVVYSFAWPDDHGDLIAWAEGCGPITRNGQAVAEPLNGRTLSKGEVVLISQAAPEFPVINTIAVSPARFLAMPGIAYRLALAAVGEGVAAVSLNGPVSWDYAAGHALVRAAGGVLLNERGNEVTYDRHGRSSVTYCFGGAPAAAQELVARNWAAVLKGGKKISRPLLKRRKPLGMALARAQGCLLGQLAGDALGSLVEFKPEGEIAKKYPKGVRVMKDGGTWDTIAGQATDDSELALALARRMAAEGEWKAESILASYVSWYQSSPFDIGGTTSAALEAASKTPANMLRGAGKAVKHSSQANGSLMRVSPIGIFAAGRPQLAASLAAQDSALTHPNSVCVAACSAFAAAIAIGVAGGSRADMIAAALQFAGTGDGAAVVREHIRLAETAAPRDFQSNQGWVLVALQNAFHWLATGTGVEQGIVETIARGGDTDTNAAIAGALLGAADGRAELPAAWIRTLLTCRPLKEAMAKKPRPADYWPDDALELAEQVLVAGGFDLSLAAQTGGGGHRNLMTTQEKMLGMGMGALQAAERLGMTYLANIDTVKALLEEYRQKAVQALSDHSDDQDTFGSMIDRLTVELTAIFSGQHDRYFAIEWFSAEQLGAFLIKHGDIGEEVTEANAIAAGAKAFLTACIASVEMACAIDEPKESYAWRTEEFLNRQTELWLGLPSGTLDQQTATIDESTDESDTKLPPRPPRAYRDEPATVDSPVFAQDVRELVAAGRRLLARWTRTGTHRPYPDPEFDEFHEWLYHAGMVMTDFDGPQFAGGPFDLIMVRDLAPLLAAHANLSTLRMYFHTMARSFRHGDCGIGYGPFEEAFICKRHPAPTLWGDHAAEIMLGRRSSARSAQWSVSSVGSG